MLALVDYAPVVAECKRLFFDDEETIAPDLQQIVYSTAVRLGEQKEYDRAFGLYQETETAAEKIRYLIAIGLATQNLDK